MMSEDDRRVLEVACPDLMRTIDLISSDLLAQLVRRAAITTQQKEFIQAKEGNSKQVEALVDILLHGNEDTMDMFIHSLRASRHTDAAAILMRPPRKDDPYPVHRQELTQRLQATFTDRHPSLSSQEKSAFIREILSIDMEEYKQRAEELLAAETQKKIEELAIGRQEEVGSTAKEKSKQIGLQMLVSRLTSRLTRKLFDLPNTVAEERAYNYLGVHHSAPNSEVNRAFRELCLRYHPDRGGDEEEFSILQNNMAVIKAARGEP